ncbi:MAG: squalene--hopene cyclase [Planctomycetia bacterium]|nr:squalene--hopene cyclase [Planctomycetia bacterium]
MLDEYLGAEEAAEFRGMLARLRGRIDAGVRRSPPFTVSLSVHVLALMLLALIFVRIERERRRPIDLSFAAAARVEEEQPGLQIVEPEPEPEPESQLEVTEQEQPVAAPIAAPEVAEAEAVAALGAEPAPAVAPAIGSLLDGREAGRRERLVAVYGGSDATEAAVGLALEWLARQQGKDGLWSLQGPYRDGASQENRLAATALALLAFQGAGNTPSVGAHKRVVAAGWTALLAKQVAGNDREGDEERRRSGAGRFEISLQDPPARQGLYAHAQATIALCELYGMTQDRAYEQPARRAVAYAVAAQGRNGGWRYEPGQDGDMSVTGWYMMALKSAQMAGLDVPQATFANLGHFLDAVAVDGGSRYGYRYEGLTRPVDQDDTKLVRNAAGPVTDAVSAEGLLCRQYLGWPRNQPAMTAGVDALLRDRFLDWDADKDVYAWYYVTQVVHHLGGQPWERWNGRMKELLPAVQVARGSERGSWDPAGDKWGPWGGRLFTTCFCTYMLEVYYRHLPLYGEQAVAASGAAP